MMTTRERFCANCLRNVELSKHGACQDCGSRAIYYDRSSAPEATCIPDSIPREDLKRWAKGVLITAAILSGLLLLSMIPGWRP